MKTHSTTPPDKYCRLFEAGAEIAKEELLPALRQLGGSMRDDGTRLNDLPEILVSAGYTYFGQLIDHDLTDDRTPLTDSWGARPAEITNHSSVQLDLDNLYGRGPFDEEDAKLYHGVRLKVGPVGDSGRYFDLAMSGHEPLVAERRSNENVIIRQVVAFFARLHNLAVGQFEKDVTDPEKLFGRARHQVTWQYQWLIVHDFLPALLDRAVYQSIFEEGNSLFEWETFAIPVEFSVAAMRFGHSMVRGNYLMSIGSEKSLVDIMSRSHRPGPLETESEIEWGRYFQGASYVPTMAMTSRPIDTRIVEPLHHLPTETMRLFHAAAGKKAHLPAASPAKSDPPELPVRSLIRGAGVRLPSGQAAATGCQEEELTEAELTLDLSGALTKAGRILRDAGMLSRSDHGTPLWYYLLRESEVRHNGNRLGPTGSRILAETIRAALQHDPNSILNHPQAKDHPPVWELPRGPRQFTHLNQLFSLARELPTA